MTEDKNKEAGHGVICSEHGRQGLTPEQYHAQMADPDSLWRCPVCGRNSHWDDARYEKHLDERAAKYLESDG